MELVQAPKHLKYFEMTDPKLAKQKEKEIDDYVASLNKEKEEGEDEDEDESYDSEYGYEYDDGADREYTGDMFGNNKPVKFSASPSKARGNLNKNLNVYEYVCFSIWRTGGKDLRYSRLKDTVVPIAPVKGETRFRTSHSAKSVYYLGEEPIEGKETTKQVLVVISL